LEILRKNGGFSIPSGLLLLSIWPPRAGGRPDGIEMVWRRQEEGILLVWSFSPFWLKKPMFQNFPVAGCNQTAIDSFFRPPYLHYRPAAPSAFDRIRNLSSFFARYNHYKGIRGENINIMLDAAAMNFNRTINIYKKMFWNLYSKPRNILQSNPRRKQAILDAKNCFLLIG
jgi:hypothetical protein